MGAGKKKTRTRNKTRRGAPEAPAGKKALPETVEGLEKALRNMLGSLERETSAIEALDEYFKPMTKTHSSGHKTS